MSVRNIRAYRERGLLDPPRRVGRAALYNDNHLRQLTTINDLLRRGFSTAHIAEFFTNFRNGHDLADLLGLQEAIFGRRRVAAVVAVPLDPNAADGRRLSDRGLAEVVDGELRFTDHEVAEIVGESGGPGECVQVMLRAADATEDAVDALAAAKVTALAGSITAKFGANYVPKAHKLAEMNRVIASYRDLVDHVADRLLRDATERHLVTAVSDYTASVLGSGWTPPP